MQRHGFDILSFAFGVIYTVLGAIFLVPTSPFDLVDVISASLRWVWPAAILLIGVAILVPLLRPRSDR